MEDDKDILAVHRKTIQWKENTIVKKIILYHILLILACLWASGLGIVSLLKVQIQNEPLCLFFTILFFLVAGYGGLHLKKSISKTPLRIGVSNIGIHILERKGEERLIYWENIELIYDRNIFEPYIEGEIKNRNGTTDKIGIIGKDILIYLQSYFASVFPELAAEQKKYNKNLSLISECWATEQEIPPDIMWIINWDYYIACIKYSILALLFIAGGCLMLILILLDWSEGIFFGIGVFTVVLALTLLILYAVVQGRIRRIAISGGSIFFYYNSKRIRVLFIDSIKSISYYNPPLFTTVKNIPVEKDSFGRYLKIEFKDDTSLDVHYLSEACINSIAFAVNSTPKTLPKGHV
ncbi:MAG: hypothetical protein QW728_00555 [Thermoplasmata archaeon]